MATPFQGQHFIQRGHRPPRIDIRPCPGGAAAFHCTGMGLYGLDVAIGQEARHWTLLRK